MKTKSNLRGQIRLAINIAVLGVSATAILTACGNDDDPRRGVLAQQNPPRVGSYENPEVYDGQTVLYNDRYYCIHDHVYMVAHAVFVPMFTSRQNIPDEPTRCPK